MPLVSLIIKWQGKLLIRHRTGPTKSLYADDVAFSPLNKQVFSFLINTEDGVSWRRSHLIPDIMAVAYCDALLIQSSEVIAPFDKEKHYLLLIHSLVYLCIQ